MKIGQPIYFCSRLLWLGLFVMFVIAGSATKVDQVRILLNRTVIQSGFHCDFNINVTVENDGTVAMEECVVRMVQNLPRDAFMSPFEISHITKQVYILGEVDLEKPAHHADHQMSNIFFRLLHLSSGKTSKQDLALPFHLRYQPVKTEDSEDDEVTVIIPSPEIFVHCKTSAWLQGCSSILNESCYPNDDEQCSWCHFIKFEVPSTLRLVVPRGNLYFLDFVFYVSLTVIFIGFVSIVYKLFIV